MNVEFHAATVPKIYVRHSHIPQGDAEMACDSVCPPCDVWLRFPCITLPVFCSQQRHLIGPLARLPGHRPWGNPRLSGGVPHCRRCSSPLFLLPLHLPLPFIMNHLRINSHISSRSNGSVIFLGNLKSSLFGLFSV